MNNIQDPSHGFLESHRLSDLGLDSLDLVECHCWIEQKLNIRIPDHTMDKVLTVRDLMEKVQKAASSDYKWRVILGSHSSKSVSDPLTVWHQSNTLTIQERIKTLHRDVQGIIKCMQQGNAQRKLQDVEEKLIETLIQLDEQKN